MPDDRLHMTRIPRILPHERVFPIQIGSELFKLSGASISSDAPSYFSQYFQCQLKQAEEAGEDISSAIRTLYIDRDPVTFKDISLHLQGYHVTPRDGTHFVRLFADAQFYSLPKLISQLYEESIFMSIGHREFQIPRDLFTDPGNSPNFFSLGFAIFFSSPEDLFPGLDREGLIRPPSILPPSVPGRSADTFAELLHLLRGYPINIKDPEHRASLLRDCRYFNFKGLEQKLIPHHISFNQARQRDEIVIRLEDILKSGISVAPEPTPADPNAAWVNYGRPYVDDRPYELVLEIGGESTKLNLYPSSPSQQPPGLAALGPPSSSLSPSDNHQYLASGAAIATGSTVGGTVITGRAEFFRSVQTRVARLFEVVATKLNLPPTTRPLGLLMASGGAGSQPATPGNTPLSEDLVRIVIEPETDVILDGKPWFAVMDDDAESPGMSPVKKRKRLDGAAGVIGAGGLSYQQEWIVKSGQWRLRIQGAKGGKSSVECVLIAVKLDAMSSERARNAERGFLGAT